MVVHVRGGLCIVARLSFSGCTGVGEVFLENPPSGLRVVEEGICIVGI